MYLKNKKRDDMDIDKYNISFTNTNFMKIKKEILHYIHSSSKQTLILDCSIIGLFIIAIILMLINIF